MHGPDSLSFLRKQPTKDIYILIFYNSGETSYLWNMKFTPTWIQRENI